MPVNKIFMLHLEVSVKACGAAVRVLLCCSWTSLLSTMSFVADNDVSSLLFAKRMLRNEQKNSKRRLIMRQKNC